MQEKNDAKFLAFIYAQDRLTAMPWYLRAAVLMVGSFAFILGLTKTYFEIKAWEVLVLAEQRAADDGREYRVYVRLYVFVAALGLTTLALGCLL
jgi:hypothetical protein